MRKNFKLNFVLVVVLVLESIALCFGGLQQPHKYVHLSGFD